MPDVSADGKLWNPVVILQGCKTRFRKKLAGYVPEGCFTETPENLLPRAHT